MYILIGSQTVSYMSFVGYQQLLVLYYRCVCLALTAWLSTPHPGSVLQVRVWHWLAVNNFLCRVVVSVCVWHWLVVNNYLCRVVVSVCVWPWLVVNNYLYRVVVSVCV